MAALIFIAGEAGVGKTTFIRQTYGNPRQYYYLNFHRYTFHMAMHEDEDVGLAAALTQMHQEAMEAYMDGKSLIIELATANMQQEVIELLEKAKQAKIRTEWIQLHLAEEERRSRLEKAAKEHHYVSSETYLWENLKVLGDILDNLCTGLEINNLGTLRYHQKSINIMERTQPEQPNRYFFVEDEVEYFVLDVDMEEMAIEQDDIPCIITYAGLEQMIPNALKYMNYKGIKVKLEESDLKAEISHLLYHHLALHSVGTGDEKIPLN
jgi:predicted kinase